MILRMKYAYLPNQDQQKKETYIKIKVNITT